MRREALLLAAALAFQPVEAATLAQKLEHQWALYQSAQDALVAKAGPISREDWEALIAPAGEWALTQDDFAALRNDQAARIDASRAAAKAGKQTDLDAMRALPAAQRAEAIAHFCSSLPKGAMLHIHPTGTLKEPTVRSLFLRNNPRLDMEEIARDATPGLYPSELSWLASLSSPTSFLALSQADQDAFIRMAFLPPGFHSFTRFDATFTFIGLPIKTYDDIGGALLDFAKRAISQGVSYVEFTQGLNRKSLGAWAQIAEDIERQTGLVVRYNAAFARVAPADALAARTEEVLALRSPYLVGIDLLADETDAPALEKGQVVYGRVLKAVRAGTSSLRRTMHAGELGDPRNPRDALLLGAERLGHGVKLEQDALALEFASVRRVPVEINLISNVRLGAIDGIEIHPFLRYLRLGLPVSLSTDDEGIFETDINRECEAAVSATDIQYAELKQLALNGIQSAFAPQDLKDRLEANLRNAFRNFEGLSVNH